VNGRHPGGQLAESLAQSWYVADGKLLARDGPRGRRGKRSRLRDGDRGRLEQRRVELGGRDQRGSVRARIEDDGREAARRGRRGCRERRADPGEKVPPVDELHREKPRIALREELVQLHDVGVADVGERAKLALESQERGGIEARHHLQRDDFTPLDVAHAMHDAHAALAEVALDSEAFGAAKAIDRAEHRASNLPNCDLARSPSGAVLDVTHGSVGGYLDDSAVLRGEDEALVAIPWPHRGDEHAPLGESG